MEVNDTDETRSFSQLGLFSNKNANKNNNLLSFKNELNSSSGSLHTPFNKN
jgi:hypothetical protein